MSTVAQNFVVALLVVIAALYATWLLLSARMRLRLLEWMLRRAGKHPNGSSVVGKILINRLQKVSRRVQSSCGNCAAQDNSPRPKR